MGRGKQITVLALIFLMLLGCVYLGIQIKNKPEPSQDETPYEGSYKETAISLPVINRDDGEEFLQLVRGLDDSVELYTILYNEDRSMVRGYKKYVLTGDLKWTEAVSDWMELEYFSDTTLRVRMLAYADTGSVYFLLHDLAAEPAANDDIVRVGTDQTIERINVRGLYKTDADENPIQIRTFFIQNNMICITDELSNSYAYSLANGTLYAQGANDAAGSIASDGSYLYLLGEGCSAVVPYSLENGSAVGTIPFRDYATVFSEKESEYEIMDYRLLSQDGLLYLTCQNGIYRYDFAAGGWTQLMDGLDCLFGRPSVVGENFIVTGGALYMFSRDLSGGSYLTMYTRRTQEEDEKLKRTVFTILSYDRSAIITEAAAAFQQQNPSLRVIYRVAHEESPELGMDDYRSQVQKELQEQNAIDVLICDSLDYQSYMDSGLFENISDLMKPMYTSAGLYGNITNAMAQTKIFVTPAKFDIYLLYGAQGITENSQTLETLSAVSERLGSPALGSMTAPEIAALLSSFYEENFIRDNSIDEEALLQTLTLLPSVVKLSGEEDGGASWFGMPGGSSAGIALIRSEADFAEFLSALNGSGAGFTGASGRFIPRSIVGINSKSANIKTAKEFLRTLYSDSVQQSGAGIGIPMQQAAVAAFTDGGIPESSLELLTLCLQSAGHVYTENTALQETLLSVLSPYLNGEITAEEAAAQIMSYTPSAMMLNNLSEQ